MRITYDTIKNEQNILKHGVSFELVSECDWQKADYKIDNRKDYGEIRYSAMLPLNGRLHNVVFIYRHNLMRIISFRKANFKERKKYEKNT